MWGWKWLHMKHCPWHCSPSHPQHPRRPENLMAGGSYDWYQHLCWWLLRYYGLFFVFALSCLSLFVPKRQVPLPSSLLRGASSKVRCIGMGAFGWRPFSSRSVSDHRFIKGLHVAMGSALRCHSPLLCLIRSHSNEDICTQPSRCAAQGESRFAWCFWKNRASILTQKWNKHLSVSHVHSTC